MGNAKSALPYDVGNEVCRLPGPSGWVLHEGKRSRDGEPVSVFRFDKSAASGAQKALAENFVKRLKTLRHPHILAYADGLESEQETCVVTESVVPLDVWLDAQRAAGESPDKLLAAVGWGMASLLKAVGFINEDCKLCHGAISTSSVLVTKGGDWKLGGLFVIGEMGGAMGPSALFRQTPDIVDSKYKSPERLEHRNEALTASGVDMWAVGALLEEALSGPGGGMPRQLQKFHGLLTARAPSDRPGAKRMMTHAGFRFLTSTPLFASLSFLEEWQLKTDPERVPFLNELGGALDNFPTAVNCYKVLPALRDAISPPTAPGGAGGAGGASGGAGGAPHPLTAVVLGPFLKITGMMSDPKDFQRLVVPTVVRLFASPDRATRVTLLRHLGGIVEHVDDKLLNGQVFKAICTGFSDNAPQMREHTVKCVVLLAPKLDAKNLNEVLLRNMVLLLKDPEPAIRTNTLICLSKIISHLNDETRKKVALSSFPQGARDNFVPARLAALRGMAASLGYVESDGAALAGKVIPGLTYALVDPSPEVRELAFSVMQSTIDRLKTMSDARAVAQQKEAEEAKQRGLEQRRVGELGQAGPAGGHGAGAGQAGAGAGTAGAGPAADGGYLTAAAGWAGSMWNRSSSTGSDLNSAGGATRAAELAAASKFNPATGSPAPSPPPSPPLGAKPPASRAATAGGGMVLTPSKKNSLEVDMNDDGFGDGWGNDDDDDDLLSGSNTGGGWGDADDDLLSGDVPVTTASLGARKKSSGGHVAPPPAKDDFFGAIGTKPAPAAKLEVRLPTSGKKPSAATAAARKAEAARKREEARKRMAERKEARKKPQATVRKASDGGGDDWDNW